MIENNEIKNKLTLSDIVIFQLYKSIYEGKVNL